MNMNKQVAIPCANPYCKFEFIYPMYFVLTYPWIGMRYRPLCFNWWKKHILQKQLSETEEDKPPEGWQEE